MPARLPRHYYDLYELTCSGVAAEAEARHELLQRVVEHKSLFFKSGWQNPVKLRQDSCKSPRRKFGSRPCATTTERSDDKLWRSLAIVHGRFIR
jgi:hypothetical protein